MEWIEPFMFLKKEKPPTKTNLLTQKIFYHYYKNHEETPYKYHLTCKEQTLLKKQEKSLVNFIRSFRV